MHFTNKEAEAKEMNLLRLSSLGSGHEAGPLEEWVGLRCII